MKDWDSSTLVSLLAEEAQTASRIDLLERDPSIVSWWGSLVECASALNRLHLEGAIEAPELRDVLEQLRMMAPGWVEIAPTDRIRDRALRLLRVHPLRSADAMQLAAALAACKENPPTLDFVCSDARLAQAASREGFSII